MYENFIPVNLLTGFLGSGKTTLLQRLLANPEMANTAVLINEFGEIGLDHLLLENVDEETVILQSGCVCCTIRGDLRNAIRALYSKRERGEVPPFDRLTIETTGLADPAPIVSTLMADPVIRHHFRLGNVITTVDGIHGEMQLAANPESVKQAAVADQLVVTKTDMASEEDVAALIETLRRINPTASIHRAADEDLRPDQLFRNDIYDPATKAAAVRDWLRLETQEDHGHHDVNRHDRGIRAFTITQEQAMDWTAFGIWLTMLLNRHGENVLRVKGILNVAGAEAPVVIHGVQYTVHPPAHLERWPSEDHRSRIVFIVRDLSPALIERSLAAFNRLANNDKKRNGEQLWARR